MASGSSKVERPTWQRTLLTVPESQRFPSQKLFIRGIENLDLAIHLLSDPIIWNDLDFKSLDVLQVLIILVHAAADLGDFACLEYYTTPKMQSRMYRALETFITQHVGLTGDQNNPNVEVLVPLALADVVFSRMHLFKSYNTEIPETESDKSADYLKRKQMYGVSWDIAAMLEHPSVMRKCDEYLRKKLGQLIQFKMEKAAAVIPLHAVSLILSTCLVLTPTPSLNTSEYRTLLLNLKDLVAQYSEALGAWPTEASITFRSNLEALDFQFKRMRECHVYLMRSGSTPITRSDPLAVEWRETTKSYLNFLKNTIRRAKRRPDGVDLYNIALLNRQLLTAMLSGVSESVTYTEIESVCNELKSAVDACATWAPPLWKLQIETDRKIVNEDVLPFLRNANPSSYKKASVDVLTPGFLDFSTPAAVYQRLYGKRVKKCDACGIAAINLHKCQACESAWYCDRECQKQDWKNHKLACKEIQRDHGAVLRFFWRKDDGSKNAKWSIFSPKERFLPHVLLC